MINVELMAESKEMAGNLKKFGTGLVVAVVTATAALGSDDLGAFDGIGAIIRDMQTSQHERIALVNPANMTTITPGTCTDPRVLSVEKRVLELGSLLEVALDKASLQKSLNSLYRLRDVEMNINSNLSLRSEELAKITKEAERYRKELQENVDKLYDLKALEENAAAEEKAKIAKRDSLKKSSPKE